MRALSRTFKREGKVGEKDSSEKRALCLGVNVEKLRIPEKINKTPKNTDVSKGKYSSKQSLAMSQKGAPKAENSIDA